MMLSGFVSGFETGFLHFDDEYPEEDPNIDLKGASGIVVSRIHDGILYLHGDKPNGDGDVDIVAIDRSANIVSRITLDTPGFDIEDIAAWHDGTNAWLFVADTGDNKARDDEASGVQFSGTRTQTNPGPGEAYRIYIFKEPSVQDLQGATITVTGLDLQVLELSLSHINDIETLMVDTDGTIYLVTKHGTNGRDVGHAARIFKIERNEWYGQSSASVSAEEVDQTDRILPLHFITGGDISPTGGEILLRNRREVWLFERAPNQTVVEALTDGAANVTYKRLPYEMEAQGEAIAFDRYGRGYYTISEAGDDDADQSLKYYERGDMLTAAFKDGRSVVIDSVLLVAESNYAGTQDTYIGDNQPQVNHGAEGDIRIDDDGDIRHGLLRFANIFGTGATQLDPEDDVEILGAEVRLWTEEARDGGTLHRMLDSWVEVGTGGVVWEDFPGDNGIVADDMIAQIIPDASIGNHGNSLNAYRNGVVDSVSAWYGGEDNEGWAILPGDAGTFTQPWRIRASDDNTVGEQVRYPELVVNYVRQRDTTLIFADDAGWTYTHLNDNPSDDGQGDHWYELDFSDSLWTAGEGKFAANLAAAEEFDTAITSSNTEFFFRKKFTATAGQVSDLDTVRLAVRTMGKVSVYFNGEQVCGECGSATFGNEFQFIEIPTSSIALVEGDNVIAVKVERADGDDPVLFQLQATGRREGDFNGDGAVDAQDIDILRDVLKQGIGDVAVFDVDGDADIDANDKSYLIETILGAFTGDLNLDGQVNISDLARLATFFGKTGAGWTHGDVVDSSGAFREVTITDLSQLAANFGQGGGSMMMSGFGEGVIELSDDSGEDVGDGLVKYIVSVETTSEDAIIALDLRITADDTGTLNQQNPDVCCGPLETLLQDNNWAFPYDEETDIDHDSQWLWNSSNLMIVWEDYESNALTYESTTVLSGVFAVSSGNAFFSRAIAQIVLPEGYTATITGRVALVGGYEEEVYWVIGDES